MIRTAFVAIAAMAFAAATSPTAFAQGATKKAKKEAAVEKVNKACKGSRTSARRYAALGCGR